MSLSLVKAVTLFTAVLLALPTGWCCGDSRSQDQADAGSRPACPACAQDAAAQRSPDHSSPSQRQSDCTCDFPNAVVLEKQPRTPAADLDAIPVARADLVPVSPVSGDSPAATLYLYAAYSGPPLHVLKCVWRC